MHDDRFACPREYYDWDGWHAVPLKCYDEEKAKMLAAIYGTRAFFCDYHECWHLSGR